MKDVFSLLAVVSVISLLPFLASARSPVMCTMQYEPVCGTTNKGTYTTYGNSCVLGAEGGAYVHDGECTAAELEATSAPAYVPPAQCTTWFDGCNTCGRTEDGQIACTLKACMGEPQAGYCTAYQDEDAGTVETVKHTPIAGATTTDLASTTLVTVEDESFFKKMWLRISMWFSGWFS